MHTGFCISDSVAGKKLFFLYRAQTPATITLWSKIPVIENGIDFWGEVIHRTKLGRGRDFADIIALQASLVSPMIITLH